MTEIISGWQCIGCGKIEVPQSCIGVCQDRKVRLVYADEHEKIAQELNAARRKLKQMETLVKQIVRTTPHDGAWERSYRAFQAQAKKILISRQ